MNTKTRASSSIKLDELVSGEIRAWMGRRRLNQSTLADALGERQQWVSRRLSGSVPMSLDDVERIAEALDVSAFDLLTGGSSLALQNRKFMRPESHTRLLVAAA